MDAIRTFFEAYSAATSLKEPKSIAEFYDHHFITADSSGIFAAQNDTTFLNWLEEVIQFNEQSGLESMKIMQVASTPIGKHYMTATVTWGASFSKLPGKLIEFDITYSLRLTDNGYKIVLYISHESQEKLMKAYGL